MPQYVKEKWRRTKDVFKDVSVSRDGAENVYIHCE